jgi:hypothetical protein
MAKAIKRVNLIKTRLRSKVLQKVINKVKTHNKKANNKKDKSSKPKQEVYKGDCIKEHYYTFQLKEELFTLLYTSLIFKWFQTDRVIYALTLGPYNSRR